MIQAKPAPFTRHNSNIQAAKPGPFTRPNK
jgi:hypothetical protein